MKGYTQRMLPFDSTFATFVVAHRSSALTDFFAIVTHAGDVVALTALTIIVAIVLMLQWREYVFPFVFASIGSALSVRFLKLLVAEPRPEGFAFTPSETFSFPSGHAAGSAVFFGFLIYIVLQVQPRWRVAIIAFLVILILTIGFSRLYLGVHYVSDVMAGYFVGGVWVWIGTLLVRSRRFQKFVNAKA